MRNTFKRTIAFLITLLMIVNVLPASAPAENSGEYGQFGLPRPDLNIFLDVPISFVESSLAANRKGDDRSYLQGKQDIHESDIEFQKRVRKIYLRQASLDKDFLVIDCADAQGGMLPPDDIFIKIKSAVDSRLNNV